MKSLHLIIGFLSLLLIINFISLVSFVNLVSAGVSSSYYLGRDLEMYAGETKEIVLYLQNQEEEEIIRGAEIVNGNEIVKIIGDLEYFLPAKTKGIEVNLKIKIPRGVEVGDKYPIKIRFTPVQGEGEDAGMVQIGVADIASFDVLVVEKPIGVGEGIRLVWMILGVILVVILMVLIWFIVKRRREKYLMPFK